MASTFLVRLRPESHFSPNLRSDQLAGALMYGIGVLFGQEFISENFNQFDPPFQVSSVFPFFLSKNNKEVSCLPFPMLIPSRLATTDYFSYKDLKKVQFLEESLFWKLVRAELSLEELHQGVPDKYILMKNCMMPRGLEFQHSSIEDSFRSHNQINRLNSKSEQFFHTASKDFTRAGLFFFLQISQAEWLDVLKASLRFLQDQGLGGDVSIGQGSFSASIKEYQEFPQSIASLNHVLLSLYSPKPTEIESIDFPKSQYNLILRQSRSRMGRMRKMLLLFTPGSLITFLTPQSGPFGLVQTVQNKGANHPPAVVWGQAISVPVRLNS